MGHAQDPGGCAPVYVTLLPVQCIRIRWVTYHTYESGYDLARIHIALYTFIRGCSEARLLVFYYYLFYHILQSN